MNGTILLADDSLTIQKVVELTFADTDHAVVTVSSGDELLEKLPTVQPDLIICDVLMPGTDGYAVCQTIKSDPKWLHIPVVLLTGTFEPFDRDRAIAAGCNEIITKPFEARKLVETVESLLQQGAQPAEEPEPPREHFEGAVAPPAFGEPVPEGGPADTYGTVLTQGADVEGAGEPVPAETEEAPTEQAPGEGLDFTTTGFDEMRAAGESPETFPEPTPDEGLEFDMEPSTGEGPLAEPFEEGKPSEEPFSAPGEAQDPEISPAVPEDAFEFGQPAEAWSAKPEGTVPETKPSGADRPATMPMEVPEELKAQPEPGEISEAAPFPAEEPVYEETTPEETPPSPFEAGAAGETEEAEDFDSPATEPVAAPGAEEEESRAVSEAPVEAVPPAPGPAFEAAEEAPAPALALSDEDVERIARRVVELAADRLEQIAWEVIPDMAELVVRERIRELEAEAEQEDTTH